MALHFGLWDILLVVIVSGQATLLAYLPEPRWKAAIFSLPIPFTLSTLAIGRPVGASNVLGLVLLVLYTQGVRLLHIRLRLPIVPAIALAALAYCGLGALLAPIIPGAGAAFWAAAVAVFALGLALLRLLPERAEPGSKSLLPPWIKLPIVAGVIIGLVLIKNTLQGFMTLFPMVGVVAAYESRLSLWTLGRQIPYLMLTLVPLMATCRLLQPYVGLGPSLALGWGVFLTIFIPLTRRRWTQEAKMMRDA